MFRKAKQNRIFEDVVDQIQDAVLEGRLPVGSRLPSEREMQEIFNASRGTLREALRVLEQKGLISIKTGVKGGAVVNDLNTDQISESLDLLIRYQRVALSDLAEFREGVESIVTALAVERAKKEDIEKLKQILGQAKIRLEEGEAGWKALLQLDNQLHLALASIAHNPIYESVLKTIYENIHRYFENFLPIKEEVLREIYQDLCDIVQAVEEGQAGKAGQLVRDHVYRFNCMMEENARKG